jgi:hypothetical protein
MNETVHQIRYRWSESSLLGTRGMGPVESTMHDDVLAGWDRYLRDRVWASSTEPGFTYVVHGDVGVLLRKMATSDGRPGSAAHALLCLGMTGDDALGLTLWEGWEEPGLADLAWSALRAAARYGLDELRRRARTLSPDHLGVMFAQLLAAPGESYTIIGEADPLAVTCALGDLIGQVPTFATDEADDTGQGLPTAVFLREAAHSTIATTRRRLGTVPATEQLGLFAAAAADAYIADGLDGIAVIRRDRPPADLTESYHWADAVQFAPGVIADLARLPKLSDAALGRLVDPTALRRVQATAATVPARDLVRALDPRLPREVATIVIGESLRRISVTSDGPALLDGLARFHPLPMDFVAGNLPADFATLAVVTRALLSRADRRTVLESAMVDQPLVELIQWVAEQAVADPEGARTGYKAVHRRISAADRDDVEELVRHAALAGPIRQWTRSAEDASTHLAALLRSVPERLVDIEVVAALAAYADPVLLHALERVVTDRGARKLVNRQVRRAYYRSHQLEEPTLAAAGTEAPDPDWVPANTFLAAFRRTVLNYRKPK